MLDTTLNKTATPVPNLWQMLANAAPGSLWRTRGGRCVKFLWDDRSATYPLVFLLVDGAGRIDVTRTGRDWIQEETCDDIIAPWTEEVEEAAAPPTPEGFSLDNAKPGTFWRTRDGRKAKIVSYEPEALNEQLTLLLDGQLFTSYTTGRYFGDGVPCDLDLVVPWVEPVQTRTVMVPERWEVWTFTPERNEPRQVTTNYSEVVAQERLNNLSRNIPHNTFFIVHRPAQEVTFTVPSA